MRQDQMLFSIMLSDHLFKRSVQSIQADWIKNIDYFLTFLGRVNFPISQDYIEILTYLKQQGEDLENV